MNTHVSGLLHAAHLRIGQIVTMTDQAETRLHTEANAGLYLCDEIPERDREFVSVEVVLNLAWASRQQ